MTTHQALVIIARFIQGVEWFGLAYFGLITLTTVLSFAQWAWEHTPFYRKREAARKAEFDARFRAALDRLFPTTRRHPE